MISAIVLVMACAPGDPAPGPAAPAAAAPVELHVDRAGRELSVIAGDRCLRRAPVGIGRGGLVAKRDMDDHVTPTGRFAVDLVLYDRPGFDRIDPAARERLAAADPEHAEILDSPDGLVRLRRSMDGLDFDGDGAPDHAYGVAYLGLDGPGTGPKLSRRGEDPYWFSIGLHGTPDPARIGRATSGGCVHVPEEVLRSLVEDYRVGPGTGVVVADGPPAAPCP
jgi:hypothetical protein